MTKTGAYEVSDICAQVNLSGYMVRRYLRLVRPNHPRKFWHRLDQSEFLAAVNELRECMEKCPTQPLHALALKRKGAI